MDGKQKHKARELWDRFFEAIKHNNRFFIDEDIIKDLVEVINLFKDNLNCGQILYRARINGIDQIKPYTTDEIGSPPNEKTGNGRANPIGISYLYTSTKISTCISEVRPFLENLVTVGTFRLNHTIKVVNLDASFPIRNDYLEYLAILLSATFSKRVFPSKTDIDYIPYQFICELVKNEGFDGIQFRSSVDPDPTSFNIVLFNEDLIECIETKLYKVTGISVDFVGM